MKSYFKNIITIFKKTNKRIVCRLLLIPVITLLVFLVGVLSYYATFTGKVYPNVSIANINIGNSSLDDAYSIISQEIINPERVELFYNNNDFVIKLSDVDFSYDIPQSIQKAYNFTRTGNFINDLGTRIKLLFQKQDFDLSVTIDHDKLKNNIRAISKSISVEPVEPSINVNGEEISVNKGEIGVVLNEDELLSRIEKSISRYNLEAIEIPIKIVDHKLTDEEAFSYTERAHRLIGKEINIIFEYDKFNFGASELIQLIDPKSGYKDSAINAFVENLAPSIERNPQEPKFTFENGKVSEFQPALDGIKIDSEGFKKLLIESIEALSLSQNKTMNIDVPVIKVSSDISTNDVNDFGIKELIGRGASTYYHSIPSRVHNVSLSASRINGTLVKPGETFSFNQTLGEVSRATGYQQAYIISEGRTILGDGGGVCQVSTTLFRALLDAGLPIVERQAHAYRVSYYEQDSPPGLDATVYSPSPDLKFTNDTPGYILIEAIANPTNYSLIFELYGTSDGRFSKISKPVVTGVSAPPPDLYQDDPTLPSGTVKQVDWKAWGAKVSFNYIVTRGGEELINKTFVSNYKPWQAVYLRGTGPASQ